MNISEVDALSNNLQWFYLRMLYPHPRFQMGNWVWYLSDGKITKGSYSLTSQQTSEYLFNGLFK